MPLPIVSWAFVLCHHAPLVVPLSSPRISRGLRTASSGVVRAAAAGSLALIGPTRYPRPVNCFSMARRSTVPSCVITSVPTDTETATSDTPGDRRTAASILAAQLPQSMPSTR